MLTVATPMFRWGIAVPLGVALVMGASCGSQPRATGTSSAPYSTTASPTATPIFVPNAESYFSRIDRYDFPTAPSSFIDVLTRSFGSAESRKTFVSFAGRSVVREGIQLPVLVAVFVVVPDLYGRPDTFDRLSDATLQGLPGAVGTPATLGSLGLPATRITSASGASYAVIYQQGFFFVQVIGNDSALLDQVARVLIDSNARRQP